MSRKDKIMGITAHNGELSVQQDPVYDPSTAHGR